MQNSTHITVLDDEKVTSSILTKLLERQGYTVTCINDPTQFFTMQINTDLILLDWLMPQLSGVEFCQMLRKMSLPIQPYIIMLTFRSDNLHKIAGFKSGADDYITKPFDHDELILRVRVGARLMHLQRSLQQRIHELEAAKAREKILTGLLPICSYCKKIRNQGDYWQQVETFLANHSEALFSHSVCPDCYNLADRNEK